MSEAALKRAFREDRSRVLATLIRLLGDFDLAEEALAEAFLVATIRWPADGEPERPAAWLLTAAKNKALDRLRRDRRFEGKAARLGRRAEARDAYARAAELASHETARRFLRGRMDDP